jgi:hypothetical protein
MTAGKYNWVIEQGATNILPITYTDDNDEPIKLNGYSARLQIRATYDAAEYIENLDSDGNGITITAATGVILITLDDADNHLPVFTQGVYDLEIINSIGEVERLIKGLVILDREATHD